MLILLRHAGFSLLLSCFRSFRYYAYASLPPLYYCRRYTFRRRLLIATLLDIFALFACCRRRHCCFATLSFRYAIYSHQMSLSFSLIIAASHAADYAARLRLLMPRYADFRLRRYAVCFRHDYFIDDTRIFRRFQILFRFRRRHFADVTLPC